MLGVLYYGRLEKEKGFDSILKVIKELHDVDFFIFGKGSLEQDLLSLTTQKNLHYFGRQPLEKIKCYLENIEYCLMPSEFLETFGLSALNALSRGIPVIGYKKG
jgi:glycosyltransferase involved in cell wall biosynthesis